MHHITMHLDFVSPYAWLAFQQLPQTLQSLSVHVRYRPVLLRHSNNAGPMEVPAKRLWTYRHAEWLGQHLGIPLQTPATHPFNPLALLRLALHTSSDGSINRYVAETVFRHVWEGGGNALDATRLQALHATLAPQMNHAPDIAEQAKQWLRSNTETASALEMFGVPAFEVTGQVFWGLDSLPMLRDFLEGHPWFASGAWENAESISRV